VFGKKVRIEFCRQFCFRQIVNSGRWLSVHELCMDMVLSMACEWQVRKVY
jgi:hypothetical protein